jgi:hypothetical protein
MRALVLSALLVAGLVTNATAQLAVGPVAITNNVNGVPVTVSATSWITVNSVGDEFTVVARIFADLIDLQRKFSNVVDGFKRHPAGDCAARGVDGQNPVVSLQSGSLWPRGDQLVMSVHGQMDIWSCVAGPPKSEIRWQKKKIAFITLKVPVRHTWRNVTKNKKGTQPFRGTLPVYLVEKDDATVALKIAPPDMKLEGHEILATSANLDLAKADLNRKIHNALQNALDLARLKEAVLPKEFHKLNVTVVSARFRDQGGHAIAEVNLAARVSGSATPALLQQIAAGSGKMN